MDSTDYIALVGLVLVSTGLYMIYVPAVPLFLGATALTYAVLKSRRG